jgi:alpha-tubulin suppressor-like RCC1 family protein
VVCWGANEYGQLGDGTIWPYRTRPVAVLGLTDVAEIASSTNHTCARLLSGEVRCWGFLRDLALSDAAWDIAPRPVPVGELTDAQQIVTGMTHSCALKRDRTVACWGSNGYGEIGNGSPIAALRPTIVPGLVDVVKLSARSFAVCAQTADGRVRCWGNNEYGGLGIEPRSRDVRTPTLVPGLPCDAALMPAAFGVVTAYGRAYSWGAVGAPANTRATLAPASELVALVGAGPFFGIRADGRLVAWGGNPDGQLGDGTTEARAEPVTVTIPPGP